MEGEKLVTEIVNLKQKLTELEKELQNLLIELSKNDDLDEFST